MKYVGLDLHKQTIGVCAVTKDKQVLVRKRLYTRETQAIRGFFADPGEIEMVHGARASGICCKASRSKPEPRE